VARDVDPKQTRKALRIVRKLAAKSAAPETVDPETGEVKPGEGAVDYSQAKAARTTRSRCCKP
jgi:hypothetical protein